MVPRIRIFLSRIMLLLGLLLAASPHGYLEIFVCGEAPLAHNGLAKVEPDRQPAGGAGIGAAIIVGTLIEDVLTGGLGTLDDPATLSLGAGLIFGTAAMAGTGSGG